MDENKLYCQYVSPEGVPCRSKINMTNVTNEKSTYCFWHDSKQSKVGPSIKNNLLAWLEEGHSLDGVHLAYADLSDLKLPRSHEKPLVNFRNADLNHANFSNAHLFAVDFTGSNLMKADLSGANINRSVLYKANLLGVRLKDTKLEDAKWGKKCRQEIEARQQQKKRMVLQAKQSYMEAEEIYRKLRIEHESRGLYDEAGHFHYRERVMHQALLTKYSKDWWLSRFVQVVCGYGESSARVITSSVGLIIFCAFLYGFLVLESTQKLNFSLENSLMENITVFGNCVYYSVMTFTTLGFGDVAPRGFAKVIAALEAFMGAFGMALFVVVFVRKLTR